MESEKGARMKCPKCGGRKLRVGVVLAGEVTCQFDTDHDMQVLQPAALDSSWDPNAECSCLSCSWSGTAAQAGLPLEVAQSGGLSPNELQTIEQELQAGDCPPQLAEAIRSLIETVRTLQNQLQIVQNMNRRNTKGGAGLGDTTIF